MPRLPAEVPSKPPPTPPRVAVEQAQAVLATAHADDTPYGAAVALALLTGLRLGEVLGLAWSSVDFDRQQARVRQSVQQIRGRGLVLREPKTAKSVRNVSLPAQAVVLLRRVQHEQKVLRMRLGSAFVDQGLAFTIPTGAPLNPQNVRRHYYLLLAAAGVPRVRFHDLRNTHATLMLSEGVHPKIVSERLGHANIGITLDTYSHALPNLQEEAARKLDALLGNPTFRTASDS